MSCLLSQFLVMLAMGAYLHARDAELDLRT